MKMFILLQPTNFQGRFRNGQYLLLTISWDGGYANYQNPTFHFAREPLDL